MFIVVDYGMGNLRSVQKALEKLNLKVSISSDASDILNADKIIIPGVGNFKNGMMNIKAKGLFEPLNEAAISRKIPILGICLGMQLMTGYSEEGDCEGFGWIRAETKKFIFSCNDYKVPHMGWNNLQIKNNETILKTVTPKSLFYFVHSYYVSCKEEINIIAYTRYGHDFVSVFNRENIFGCQLHPEKSHDDGLTILKNFSEL